MAAVLSLTPLSAPHPTIPYHRDQFHHSTTYPAMAQKTPEKLSLPSISSLIRDVAKQTENGPLRSPVGDRSTRTSRGSGSPHSPERLSFAGSPRTHLPPTPPLPGISRFDFPPRLTTGPGTPTVNGHSQPGCFAASPASTAPEIYVQTRSTYPPIPDSASTWAGTNSPASQRRPSDEMSQHNVKPIPRSTYPDPGDATLAYPGLAQQRPLPTNFPPPIMSPAQPTALPIDPQMASMSYHHHQQHPLSAQAAFSQTTDRYVCSTCQKAFSRPSSLKIHTYSHTGEKPFKCKHDGCGKYFSVRSNMKRHEKGCHGGSDSASVRGDSPANLKAKDD